MFVAKNGSTDRLADVFLGGIHAAAISASYKEGVRHTLKAGGDGMSGRAMLVSFGLPIHGMPWKTFFGRNCFQQVSTRSRFFSRKCCLVLCKKLKT